MRAFSTNRSTELRERVALYRLPFWTVNSPAKLATLKVAVIAKAAKIFSNWQTVFLVITNILRPHSRLASAACGGVLCRTGVAYPPISPKIRRHRGKCFPGHHSDQGLSPEYPGFV